MMNKKQWQKPELIVPIRGKPEEAVLGACKGNDTPTSYNSVWAGCHGEYHTTYCTSQCWENTTS
jgi:hypothetical protein